MVMHEFQTLELPDRVAGTSSIMPQKRNPVVMEHLKGKSAVVLGNYVTAATAMRTTSFSNTIDGSEHLDLAGAWATFRECCDCLKLSTVMVDAARPNRERMLDLAEHDFTTAKDFADAMVRDAAASRFATPITSSAGWCASPWTRTSPLMRSPPPWSTRPRARWSAARSNMPPATVATCLDPTKAVHARRTVGSPAPQEVRRRAAALAQALAAARDRRSHRRARLAAANERLQGAMRELSLTADPVVAQPARQPPTGIDADDAAAVTPERQRPDIAGRRVIQRTRAGDHPDVRPHRLQRFPSTPPLAEETGEAAIRRTRRYRPP